MKYIFLSSFAKNILAYVHLRSNLGNQEDTFARRLNSFDKFCVEHYPSTSILTQELAESWCTLRLNEKENTLQLRTNILRGFAKYLISIGNHAYIIPHGFVGKGVPYIPYLYTKNELVQFFYGADHLPPHPLSLYREYIIPVLFRTLYCCGLRPQEGRLLKRQDVDLDTGTLCIMNSKKNKDRIVPMSKDLHDLCRKYDIIMQKRLPNREFFFQNPNGGPFTASWIQNQFFKCWKVAGISFDQNHKPRVYSWRHNFATKVIMKWIHEDKDVSLLLPYLSTYMGHESLEYTAHYIHLVPEHLRSSNFTEWKCSQEVPDDED
jgi:integrase